MGLLDQIEAIRKQLEALESVNLFGQKRGGLSSVTDAIKSSLGKRGAQVEEAADQYGSGERSLPEAALRTAGAAAGVVNDLAGAAFGSVITPALKAAGRYASQTAQATFGPGARVAEEALVPKAKQAVGSGLEAATEAYGGLKEAHPRAMESVESVANVANALTMAPAAKKVSPKSGLAAILDDDLNLPIPMAGSIDDASKIDKGSLIREALAAKEKELGRPLTNAERGQATRDVVASTSAPKEAPTAAVASPKPSQKKEVLKKYDIIAPEGGKLMLLKDKNMVEGPYRRPTVKEITSREFKLGDKPPVLQGKPYALVEVAAKPAQLGKAVNASSVDVAPGAADAVKSAKEAISAFGDADFDAMQFVSDSREAAATYDSFFDELVAAGDGLSDNLKVVRDALEKAVKEGDDEATRGVIMDFLDRPSEEIAMELAESGIGKYGRRVVTDTTPKSELQLDKVPWAQIRSITAYDADGVPLREIKGPAGDKRIPKDRTYWMAQDVPDETLAALQRGSPAKPLHPSQERLTTPSLEKWRGKDDVSLSEIDAQIAKGGLNSRDEAALKEVAEAMRQDGDETVPFAELENRVQATMTPMESKTAGDYLKDGQVVKGGDAHFADTQVLPENLRSYKREGYGETVYRDLVAPVATGQQHRPFERMMPHEEQGKTDLFGWSRDDFYRDKDGKLVASNNEEQNDLMQHGHYESEYMKAKTASDSTLRQSADDGFKASVYDWLSKNPEMIFGEDPVTKVADILKKSITSDDTPLGPLPKEVKDLYREQDYTLERLAEYAVAAGIQDRNLNKARLRGVDDASILKDTSDALRLKAEGYRNAKSYSDALHAEAVIEQRKKERGMSKSLTPLKVKWYQRQTSESLAKMFAGGADYRDYPDGDVMMAMGRGGSPWPHGFKLNGNPDFSSVKAGDIVENAEGTRKWVVRNKGGGQSSPETMELFPYEPEKGDVIVTERAPKLTEKQLEDFNKDVFTKVMAEVRGKLEAKATPASMSEFDAWLSLDRERVSDQAANEMQTLIRSVADSLEPVTLHNGTVVNKESVFQIAHKIAEDTYYQNRGPRSVMADTFDNLSKRHNGYNAQYVFDRGPKVPEGMEAVTDRNGDTVMFVKKDNYRRNSIEYAVPTEDNRKRVDSSLGRMAPIYERYQEGIPKWLKAVYGMTEYIDELGLRRWRVRKEDFLKHDGRIMGQAEDEEEKYA